MKRQMIYAELCLWCLLAGACSSIPEEGSHLDLPLEDTLFPTVDLWAIDTFPPILLPQSQIQIYLSSPGLLLIDMEEDQFSYADSLILE